MRWPYLEHQGLVYTRYPCSQDSTHIPKHFIISTFKRL
uniref:Uncharacterized protein n=1 Tax=Anguilla anguilla TaxID=7936 RepID=A0A0E9T2W6_ANGAN